MDLLGAARCTSYERVSRVRPVVAVDAHRDVDVRTCIHALFDRRATRTTHHSTSGHLQHACTRVAHRGGTQQRQVGTRRMVGEGGGARYAHALHTHCLPSWNPYCHPYCLHTSHSINLEDTQTFEEEAILFFST